VRRRGHERTGHHAGNEGNVDFGRFDCFSRGGYVEFGRVAVRGHQLEHDRNVAHARVMLCHEKSTGIVRCRIIVVNCRFVAKLLYTRMVRAEDGGPTRFYQRMEGGVRFAKYNEKIRVYRDIRTILRGKIKLPFSVRHQNIKFLSKFRRSTKNLIQLRASRGEGPDPKPFSRGEWGALLVVSTFYRINETVTGCPLYDLCKYPQMVRTYVGSFFRRQY